MSPDKDVAYATNNLGPNFPAMALAGLLALLAGCVPSPPPSATARANLQNPQNADDMVSVSCRCPARGYDGRQSAASSIAG